MPALNDHEVARRVAEEAAALLLEIREGSAGGAESGRRGDAASHRLIMARLAELRPDDAILSEEGRDDTGRVSRQRVWIVDPLDGTREFGEPGRDDWAVHVALCVDGTPVAGAVALPAQGRVFATDAPPSVAERSGSGRPRIVASRTRAPELVHSINEALQGELIFMGSAGAKAMAVLTGVADIYVHAGGQYEWDSAAPVAVAGAAGLHCSRLDGTPPRYNQPNPYLPDLLVCVPELAGQVLQLTNR